MGTKDIKRIALAVAPSPRLEANLAESCRLRTLLNAQLVLVHVGDAKSEMEQMLSTLLPRFGVSPQQYTLVWKTGDTVNGILEACRENHVDLLIAGALEKEGLLQYFLGSVARNLCRKAECSVLMLTDPSLETHSFRHIVVEGNNDEKTPETIGMALQLARLEKDAVVDIVQESEYHKIAQLSSEEKSSVEMNQIRNELMTEEKQMLNSILLQANAGDLKINTRQLEGKPGFTISNYAREQHADLLVINCPDRKLNLLDRVFTHDMEYILANLPCNLLLVQPQHLN